MRPINSRGYLSGCLLPRPVEAGEKQSRQDEKDNKGPQQRFIGFPPVKDCARNHRADNSSPCVKQSHVAANLGIMLPAEQIAHHRPAEWKSSLHGGKKIVNKHRDHSEPLGICRNIALAAANRINAFMRGLFALSATQPITSVAPIPRNA